jgi:hypothetical protein
MQRSPKFPGSVVLLSLAVGLAMCATIRPVWAQSNGVMTMPDPNNTAGLVGRHGLTPPPPTAKPSDTAPAALPGATTRSDRVAPAKGTVIADPNEALFDSINRGDIAAARDALDRGAELDAHNVLGMTPLDLSVDLGRNDITFLLLSLRNGDMPLGHRAAAQGQTAQTGKTAQTKAGSKATPADSKSASAGTRQAARAPATSPVKQAAQVTPAAPVAPRLFAGDGGTPNPTAGFLGFGNRP